MFHAMQWRKEHPDLSNQRFQNDGTSRNFLQEENDNWWPIELLAALQVKLFTQYLRDKHFIFISTIHKLVLLQLHLKLDTHLRSWQVTDLIWHCGSIALSTARLLLPSKSDSDIVDGRERVSAVCHEGTSSRFGVHAVVSPICGFNLNYNIIWLLFIFIFMFWLHMIL